MRWYVVSPEKIIMGRYGNLETAIFRALMFQKWHQYSGLWVIKEEDYSNNNFDNAVFVTDVPTESSDIWDLVKKYLREYKILEEVESWRL
jgi:hypothetical protein